MREMIVLYIGDMVFMGYMVHIWSKWCIWGVGTFICHVIFKIYSCIETFGSQPWRQVTHLFTAERTSHDMPTFAEERRSECNEVNFFFFLSLFIFSFLSLFSYSKAPAITLILRSLWALITAFISTLTCLMLFVQAGDDRQFEGNALWCRVGKQMCFIRTQKLKVFIRTWKNRYLNFFPQ